MTTLGGGMAISGGGTPDTGGGTPFRLNLTTGSADGCGSNNAASHISGGCAFNYCQVICSLTSADRGEFLGTLLVGTLAGGIGHCCAS